VPKSDSKEFEALELFGCKFEWSADKRLLITVIIAGALGSLVHVLTSFADYVGNRQLAKPWIWWFVLRVPIGISLALLFYLVVRAGMIVPSVQGGNGGGTQSLNVYGVAAFAALAGMFSKQATDKMREVFETLFTPQKPVPRADSLAGKSGIIKVEPDKLAKGTPEVLTVTGHGFLKDAKATIGGKPRDMLWVSESQIKVTTLPEDVQDTGTLTLVVQNPNMAAFEVAIEIVDAKSTEQAVAKPAIASTDPEELTVKGPISLDVIGEGFQKESKATVNDEDRDTSFVDEKKLTVTLKDDDVAAEGKLTVVVKNSDTVSSDPHEVAVKAA
jgi:hypothetical protein